MRKKIAARRIVPVCVLIASCVWLSLSASIHGAPSDLVISQVYGAGGNTGATYQSDFIEIYNRGSAAVSLQGKSLQYASATGTGNFGASTTQLTELPNITLVPGQYFLIQEASGTTGSPLPVAPDLIDATPINMSASAGKVALVDVATSLGCNGGSNVCDATQSAHIIDLVGYGSANFFEGSGPAPALSATSAAIRVDRGRIDTDNNATDFTVGPPAPRNSSLDLSISGSAVPSTVAAGESVTLLASVTRGSNPVTTGLAVNADLSSIGGLQSQPLFDNGNGAFSATVVVSSTTPAGLTTISMSVTDTQARSATTSVQLLITAPVPSVAIHDIQGTGVFSAWADNVLETEGVVTAIKTNGFFIQAADSEVDADPLTSEGIFVFTSSAPPAAAAVGNRLRVRGRVQDFIPSADPFSPPVTEMVNATPTVLSNGNPLPAPITVTTADLNPSGTVSQLSRYEGMRVHIDTLHVVAPSGGTVNEPNASAASNGVFFGVFPGTPRPFREPGIEAPAPAPAGVPYFDGNPERIRVDSDGQLGGALVSVLPGDDVSDLTGVLDYAFRTATVLPDPPGSFVIVSGDLHAAPVRDVAAEGEISIASINLERFYDTTNDPATSDQVLTASAYDKRLAKASLAIRNILRSPNILGVEEMENLTTLQDIANRINTDAVAAGQENPNYVPYLVEGNDIGGIDVGFLVNSSRVDVMSVDQFGKDATFVQPDGSKAILNDRPPLLMRATVKTHGKEMPLSLTVIVNHLRSLNDIENAVDGARVRAKRFAQAEFLANLINDRQLLGESVVSVGDYNAFDVNDGYVDVINTVRGGPAHPSEDVLGESSQIVATPLIDLTPVDPSQHYSYVFNGNAQVLDHIIVSQSLTVNDFVYGRTGSDFAETVRNDVTRPERVTDHDAPVSYIAVPRDTVPPTVTLTGVTENASYTAGSVPTAVCTTTDDSSGVNLSAVLTITGGNADGTGDFTATCAGATDQAGNVAAPVSVHYRVRSDYRFGGFEAPFGSRVAVKRGSTVPLKFQLWDSQGTLVTSLSAITAVQVVRNASCGGDPVGDWQGADTTGGTGLRFDGTRFVFNWSTAGLAAGCYSIGVKTADAITHTTEVTIR